MNFINFFFILFLAIATQAYAFSGGSMMQVGGRTNGSVSGTGNLKSGITIVDPSGKSMNCEPFVDKKWDSTDYIDSWNGVYFSVGAESSRFSGNITIDNSSLFASQNQVYPIVSNINKPLNLSGSSGSALINIGGGTLIDRVYLGSDLEIKSSKLISSVNLNVDEYRGDLKTNENSIDTKLEFTVSSPIIFNAKIGYLITDRFMAYFNTGIASFASYDVSDKIYNSNVDTNPALQSPIRLSVGGEYLLSNHFRLFADYSYWIIPKIYGEFYMTKKNNANSSSFQTRNSFVAKMNINSGKFGILYRF